MRLNVLLAGTGLLLASLALGTSAIAQDEPAAPAEEAGGEEKKSKTPFGLYVEAATGVVSARDIDASITTLSTHQASSYLSLEDQAQARAALGWRLPHGKGDFRIRFDGYKEEGYTFHSDGLQASLDQSLELVNPVVADNLLWWSIDVVDGAVHAVRTPPVWDPLVDDANANGEADADEIRYPYVDRDLTSTNASDLQNRAQAIDLLYGKNSGTVDTRLVGGRGSVTSPTRATSRPLPGCNRLPPVTDTRTTPCCRC